MAWAVQQPAGCYTLLLRDALNALSCGSFLPAMQAARKGHFMNKRPHKAIPRFASEAAERKYWETHDSSTVIDWAEAKRTILPNLKPTTESISPRLPVHLLERIKTAANVSRRTLPVFNQSLARRESEEGGRALPFGRKQSGRLRARHKKTGAPLPAFPQDKEAIKKEQIAHCLHQLGGFARLWTARDEFVNFHTAAPGKNFVASLCGGRSIFGVALCR